MTDVTESFKRLTVDETESLSEKLSSAAEGEDAKKKIKFQTSDNVTLEVQLPIVKEMKTVQDFIETSGVADDSLIIPLPNVTSYYLTLIIDYCKEHCRVAEPGKQAEMKQHLKEFDQRFVEKLNVYELKELIIAAHYLNMETFFDFLATNIADAIKNKSPEFVRSYFGLVNDYTPEEEAVFRSDNAWAFRGVDVDED